MITGRPVWQSDTGGLFEIYKNDRFVGSLQSRSFPGVGFISFTPTTGNPGELEVDIGWWLSTSLDYRQREVHRLIEDCLSFSTPCPMTVGDNHV